MKNLLLGALALVAIVAGPGAAFAATYAYVNNSGEVMTTDSSSASSALSTAPGIAVHSGVMLIEVNDPVVGDGVPGV